MRPMQESTREVFLSQAGSRAVRAVRSRPYAMLPGIARGDGCLKRSGRRH